MSKVYNCYSDPRHGWIKVDRKELVKLGIADKISSCSFQRKNFVYLEEDRDASLFVKALHENGITPVYKEYHTDRSSKIRSYDSYSFQFPSIK